MSTSAKIDQGIALLAQLDWELFNPAPQQRWAPPGSALPPPPAAGAIRLLPIVGVNPLMGEHPWRAWTVPRGEDKTGAGFETAEAAIAYALLGGGS